MTKTLSLFMILMILLSCGQKSTIKPNVKVRTMAEQYGDGSLVNQRVIIPLSDQAIAGFKSPIEELMFVFGGLAKIFMDVGIGVGLGKRQVTLVQPIPSLNSDYIKKVKIKRIFFYIEPKEGEQRTKNFIQRLFRGRSDVNFNFLKKLAVKVSAETVGELTSWHPEVFVENLKRKEVNALEAIIDNKAMTPVNAGPLKELVLVKYERARRDKYLRNKEFGKVFILTTKEPGQTKKFFNNHPHLKEYIKHITMLNRTILVELNKDPISEEGFQVVISEEAGQLEEYGVSLIEQCTEKTCLELQSPDVDVLPLLMQGNALKIDAFIKTRRVPDSFQLKGFIELEVKVSLPF